MRCFQGDSQVRNIRLSLKGCSILRSLRSLVSILLMATRCVAKQQVLTLMVDATLEFPVGIRDVLESLMLMRGSVDAFLRVRCIVHLSLLPRSSKCWSRREAPSQRRHRS